MKSTQLTLPVVVVGSILIFQYIGFPILYFELDDYRSEFITDVNLVVKAWIITSITTLLLCIGVLMARFLFGSLKYNYFYNSQIKSVNKNFSLKVFIVGLICVLVMYLYISKIGFGNLALTIALTDNAQEIAISRSKMGNDFEEKIYFYNLFMRDILVLISLVIFSMKLMGAANVNNIVIALVFSVVSFSLVMSAEKGLFADYLTVIFFLYCIVKRNGQISFKEISILLILMLFFLVPSYMFFMGDSSVYKSILSIVSRTFAGSIQPGYHYLDFFPNYHNWLYGASLPNPGGLLPFESYNLTLEIKNFVDNYKSTSVIGTMPAVYWGEIYANFGYYGLVLIPPFIGFLLYSLNSIVFNVKLQPLSAGFFAWLLVHYKNISITSLSMYLFDTTLLFVITITLIINYKFSLK